MWGYRMGPGWGPHAGWEWLGGLVPLLMFLVLVGLGIWLVVRLTGTRARPMSAAPGGPAPLASPGPRPDAASEQLRMRYARGEIGREEFLVALQDLAGAPGVPGVAGTTGGAPAAPEPPASPAGA